MEKREIIFLMPVCTENIWGGTRLRDEFHYKTDGDRIGECWGISAHPNREGIVLNGSFAGKRLSELWKEHPELFGYYESDRFPLLTKIIDAKENLSVQVHPDDCYAAKMEQGSLGKTECWYVLDCPEHAGLVIGHNAQSKTELRAMIHQGRWKELIREIPVKKGDFIQIEPGTVHAIKGGFLILETQQNSDITYRMYDYDRRTNGTARELHIEKSIDVVRVPEKEVADCVLSTSKLPTNRWNCLYCGYYYSIFKGAVDKRMEVEQKYPFLLVSICEGSGTVNGLPVKKGDHFIVPSGFGNMVFEGQMMLIASAPGCKNQNEG